MFIEKAFYFDEEKTLDEINRPSTRQENKVESQLGDGGISHFYTNDQFGTNENTGVEDDNTDCSQNEQNPFVHKRIVREEAQKHLEEQKADIENSENIGKDITESETKDLMKGDNKNVKVTKESETSTTLENDAISLVTDDDQIIEESPRNCRTQ